METFAAISVEARHVVDSYLRTLGSNDERIAALRRLHADFCEAMSDGAEAKAVLAALQEMIDQHPRH